MIWTHAVTFVLIADVPELGFHLRGAGNALHEARDRPTPRVLTTATTSPTIYV